MKNKLTRYTRGAALMAALAVLPTAATLAGDRDRDRERGGGAEPALHVDDDSPAAKGDGLTWETSFRTIDEAIEVAAKGGPMLIKVAQGTYTPQTRLDPDLPQSATYFINFEGLTIEGGYGGYGAAAPDRRSLDPTLTVLDGDLRSGVYDGPDVCGPGAGDCFEKGGNGTPGCESGECCETVCAIDPFCCDVEWDETCAQEATIFCGMPAPPNVFHIMTIDDPDGTVRIDGFTFINGNAVFDEDESHGAAVFIEAFRAEVALVRCRFMNNHAVDGGAVAAIGQNDEVVTVFVYAANCWFQENSAEQRGGGLYLDKAEGVISSTVMILNYAGAFQYGGGAVYNGGGALFRNATIVANHTDGFGGGVRSLPLAEVGISNSVFWGNRDFDGGVEASQIRFGDLIVNYSDIEGLTGDLGGVGNFNLDPRFVNPPTVPGGVSGGGEIDLGLLGDSPCIDSGANSLIGQDLADVDIDGVTNEVTPRDFGRHLRKVNNPFVDDGGQGQTQITDVGALEYPPITGDVDGDGDVDPYDLAKLLAAWGPCALFCDADWVPDDIVDNLDVAALLDNWTAGDILGGFFR